MQSYNHLGFCLNRDKSNKFRLKNQQGATIVEASIILPLFFTLVFGTIIICTQLFACYKTYYATYLTLRAISTGPTYKLDGSVDKSVITRFQEILPNNFTKYSAGVKLGTDRVIVRTAHGCYDFNSIKTSGDKAAAMIRGNPNMPLNCPNGGPTFSIIPNSWLTIESYVKPSGLKFKKIPIPEMKIVSTARMYDWS